MAIKNNQAIINFIRTGHAELALEKLQNLPLNNMPLQLYPYIEGELDRPQPLPTEPIARSQQPAINMDGNEVILPQPKLSELTIMVEEALKISNQEGPLQKVTRVYREKIIKFISSYNPLLETAARKHEEVMNSDKTNKEKQEALNRFNRFYEKGLGDMMASIEDGFKIFRNRCESFGRPENVEVDPPIQISKAAVRQARQQPKSIN